MRSELQSCIDAMSTLMMRLSDVNQQRELLGRTRYKLAAWLETMNDDVRRLLSQPAKLHIMAAELEIRQLEVKHFYRNDY